MSAPTQPARARRDTPRASDTMRARARQARAAAARLAGAGGVGTVADIARAWNLTEGAVRFHTQNPTFPPHAFTVGQRRVWTMAEVDAWRETQPTRTPRA